MSTTTYLFVGERPSPKAARIGATWQNGRLSAKNLREALHAAGLNPDDHEFINLFGSNPEPDPNLDSEPLRAALLFIRQRLAAGHVVIGMGEIVCRVLRRENIPHRQMVHPAARGAIRKTERYRAHVAEIVTGGPAS